VSGRDPRSRPRSGEAGDVPSERLLSLARLVPLLAVATPANALEERARLLEAAARGGNLEPRWHYKNAVASGSRSVRHELESLASIFSHRRGTDIHGALAPLYAERASELASEAQLCEKVGTADFGKLAAKRFAPFADASARAADDLADRWLTEEASEDEEATMATDDPHPSSLLSRLRREVATRRLPFSVTVQPRLFALAATGQKTILVASGRQISDQASRRTALHEIEGHVMPRVRAAESGIGLLSLGTARGIDEQEGYALALEDRHGFLSPSRRRELAARYVAVRAMRRGSTFGETFRLLTRKHGLAAKEAIGIAERAFRGGSGHAPGLGRESVYLESFIRVREHLGGAPADEAILGSGQMSLAAIDAVRPWLNGQT